MPNSDAFDPRFPRPGPGDAVDVVVPAHNAGETLEPCLQALVAAGFSTRAIWVVDDGSTDDTAQIARDMGVQVIRAEAQQGAAVARNLGAAAGTHPVILFVDADVAVHGDVKTRLAQWFDQSRIAAVFGSYDATPHHPAAISRLRNVLHHHVHQTSGGPVASFWTGLGAVRRSVFAAVGGFDPGQAMMEDVEFGLRLHRSGHQTQLDPNLQGTHWKYWSLRSMIRTDLWHRAVPWTRLLRSPLGRSAPQALNVSVWGKVSVLGAAGVCVGLATLVVAPWGGLGLMGLGLVAIATANRRFLRLVHRLDGLGQLPAAMGMLAVHFSCAGLGYLLVRLRLV